MLENFFLIEEMVYSLSRGMNSDVSGRSSLTDIMNTLRAKIGQITITLTSNSISPKQKRTTQH